MKTFVERLQQRRGRFRAELRDRWRELGFSDRFQARRYADRVLAWMRENPPPEGLSREAYGSLALDVILAILGIDINEIIGIAIGKLIEAILDRIWSE